jgi:hypothetical protein
MTIVKYASEHDTDYKKLMACYSLIEQMRLEHNRVAEIARSNPEKYLKTGKFRTYAKESKSRLMKLLAERNLLMENIRWANYAPKQWEAVSELSLEGQDNITRSLFGDKKSEQVKPTGATSPLLDDLRAISLDDLGESRADDPTVDFTSATWNNGSAQSDPNSRLTIISNKVTATSLPQDEEVYFYGDYGANYFDGDFEHRVEALLDGYSGTYIVFPFWILSNTIDDLYGHLPLGNKDFLALLFYWNAGGSDRIRIWERDGSSSYNDDWIGGSLDVTYFFTIERDESVGTYGTFYAYIATGDYYDNGGNLEDTLSIALHTSKKDFQYLYAESSYNQGDGTKQHTGYMQNLDLQEGGGVTEKSGSDSGSGTDAKASGNPVATLTKSETGSGADVLTDLLAVLTGSDIGSGAEQSLLSFLLSSSDSGAGAEALSSLLAELTNSDTGAGVESLLDRDIVLGDIGEGLDAILTYLRTLADSGAGTEASEQEVQAVGRILYLKVITSQHRKLNTITSQYRKLKTITSGG